MSVIVDKDLAVLSYANGFTVWVLKKPRSSYIEITQESSWLPVMSCIRENDVIYVVCLDGTIQTFVHTKNASNNTVSLIRM